MLPWYTPFQFAGNKPIWAIDLDGLEEITIHSAYWTKEFLNIDFNAMTHEEIESFALNYNKDYKGIHGGYKDKNSQKWAALNYESPGAITSVNKLPKGELSISGYTNVISGDVIKFTILSSLQGKGVIEIEIPEVKKGMQGAFGEGISVPKIAGTFAMKYSGFGKLSRALVNYMEGTDPWTGENGSTTGLIIGGVTDLATMGYGGAGTKFTRIKDVFNHPAIQNQTMNGVQEIFEHLYPEDSKTIGLVREGADLVLSFDNKDKILKTVEVASNLIQAVMIAQEPDNNKDKSTTKN